MIWDEGGFMDKKLMNALLPLLQAQSSAWIVITTQPTGGYDEMGMTPFHRLLGVKKEGRPVIRNINISLVCDACRALGIADRCPHRDHLRPHWISGSDREDVMALMAVDAEAQAKELLNETSGTVSRLAFKTANVDLIENMVLDTRKLPARVDDVYIAIDPSGGGESSDIGIVAGWFNKNKMVIQYVHAVESSNLGMYQGSPHEAAANEACSLIMGLRRIPRFATSRVSMIIEAQLAGAAPAIWNWIRDKVSRLGSVTYIENTQGKMGITVSHKTDEEETSALDIAIVQNSFSFAPDFMFSPKASKWHEGMNKEKIIKSMKNLLVTQMRDYRVTVERLPSGTVKYKYSGKSEGKNDLVSALKLLFFWSRRDYMGRLVSGH